MAAASGAPPADAGAPATTPAADPPDVVEVAAVFAGGVAGALLRAAVHETWKPAAGAWPWATFAVNVAGAFVLGLVAARWARSPGRPGVPRALLGTGFCGALTTFSTLQLELVQLLRGGDAALALGYAAASLVAGLAACRLGATVSATRSARA